jgi:archaeal type IV pilus assembly protein PilA
MESKKMKSFRRSIKAVSPVIATIIIVAIAITMSIAVAYWLLGLGSSFTKFEKVEFSTAFVTGSGTTGSNYTINLGLKNTGSAAATIDQTSILYNGKPANVTSGAGTIITTFTPSVTMNPGETATGTIVMPITGYSSGMTLEITLHTTGGKDYPKAVVLP